MTPIHKIFCFLAFTVIDFPCLAQSSALYISTDEAKEDVAFLIKTFEEVHYNPYFKISKEEFLDVKDNLLSQWNKDSITLKHFIATTMKLAAQLSGGHSYADWQNPNIIPEIKEYQYLPFTGKINAQNQFEVTKSNISSIETGSVIENINGLDISQLFKECKSYIGGIEAFKNIQCEKVFPLYLFFNLQLQSPYVLTTDANTQTINVEGVGINDLLSFLNSSQIQENYTFEILKDKIALISYNSCTDYDAFKKFLEQSFKEIHSNRIDKLIIDIRANEGGNSLLNDLLLSYITKKSYRQFSGRYWKVSEQSKKAYASNEEFMAILNDNFKQKYFNASNQEIIESFGEDLITPKTPNNYFDGKTCLLIGPETFSSANLLADAIKTYNIATLIGTHTGEYTNDFGEQISFTLPNSGNTIFISTTYDIGANGDHNILEPVYPDIEVEKNVLQYAVQWIQTK